MGIYNVTPEKNALAAEKGLKIYNSLEQILGDDGLDIILVSTTNEVHRELSIKAMEAGKHVICEKPVTLSSAELAEVMEAAFESWGRREAIKTCI